MTDVLQAELLKGGILGVAVLALAAVIVALWRDLRAAQRMFLEELQKLQAQRVDDAKGARDAYVVVVKECTSALNNNAQAVREMAESSEGLRESFKELAEEIRARRTRRD